METRELITAGVLVSVSTQFRADLSQIESSRYFFNYTIFIANKNNFPVQLLHRDWFVHDALKMPYRVSGQGVIGEQPIFEPGFTYDYTSGCELDNEIGTMSGYYTFQNLVTKELFEVQIPKFSLIYPGRLN